MPSHMYNIEEDISSVGLENFCAHWSMCVFPHLAHIQKCIYPCRCVCEYTSRCVKYNRVRRKNFLLVALLFVSYESWLQPFIVRSRFVATSGYRTFTVSFFFSFFSFFLSFFFLFFFLRFFLLVQFLFPPQ